MTLSLLGTIGSGTLILLGALWFLALTVKGYIRDGNREVVNALKHDTGDVQRLRAEFEALKAAVDVETKTHRQLTEQTKRRAHLKAV